MDDVYDEIYNLIFVCEVMQSSVRYCRHEKEALEKIQKILELVNELIKTIKEPAG